MSHPVMGTGREKQNKISLVSLQHLKETKMIFSTPQENFSLIKICKRWRGPRLRQGEISEASKNQGRERDWKQALQGWRGNSAPGSSKTPEPDSFIPRFPFNRSLCDLILVKILNLPRYFQCPKQYIHGVAETVDQW